MYTTNIIYKEKGGLLYIKTKPHQPDLEMEKKCKIFVNPLGISSIL